MRDSLFNALRAPIGCIDRLGNVKEAADSVW